MKKRNNILKRGFCLAVILLLTTVSVASINASVIEKKVSTNNTQLDRDCYIGEWTIRFFNPIVEFKWIPEAEYNITEPIICELPEVNNEVQLQFTISLKATSNVNLQFPFRLGGFHCSLWDENWDRIWSKYFPKMILWKVSPCAFTTHIFPDPPVSYTTNNQNKTIYLVLSSFTYPLPPQFMIWPFERKTVEITIVPI